MRTTFLSDKLLNNAFRNTAYTPPATVYAGLLTAVTDAEAGTVTEASFAGYARVAATFAAPGANLGGRQIVTSGATTFAAKTDAGSVSIIAVGIYDAISAGNLMEIIYLDGADPFVGVVTDIASDLIRSTAHGLTTDQLIRLEQFSGTGTFPTGPSENTTYFVLAAGLTTDDFKISLTSGGAAIDLTAVGKVLIHRLTPKSIAQNDQANFAAGALKIAED